ncbi:MAG TPA: tRNA lysidine(34) synthetase TilS, partial [Armatimonadota bacterium]
MSRVTDLQQTMLATISRFSMVHPGDKVLVALSGGPDSVTLLHALWTAREELGITLLAAHLNHSIRGRESDKDAEYASEFAASLGVECTVEKIDVPEIRKSLRLSEEETARIVRYDFLERTAANTGCSRIAVAHNADDQVETVILNVLRGTGLDGLSGMPPVRGQIIRPLIDVKRSQIEAYIEEHNLSPRTDLTNLEPKYTRNRVRLKLLPFLREEFNTNVDAAILRIAELARVDSTYLNIETESALARSATQRAEGTISIDAESIIHLPLAIR